MTGIYYDDIIMTIRRDYMTMAGLDMTWAMTMTALHIYIMAFILLINIMRRFHGLYAHLRMARFHALIQMGGPHAPSATENCSQVPSLHPGLITLGSPARRNLTRHKRL